MDSTKVTLGIATEVHDTYLDPDNIVAYGLASNHDNPRYLDGSAVPPLFAVVVAWSAFWAVPPLPPEASEGMLGGVHGEHDLFIHQPMIPGTWLHTVGEISAVICSPNGMNVFKKLVSTNDEGDEVLTQYWSSFFRGHVSGGDQGRPPPDHGFPETARSRVVGSVTLPTTRDQTFRYAGASGDRSSMHVDDEVARSLGFPRKINQGLATLAVTTRGLIDLAAAGDPRRIRRVAARFSSPVFPGDPVDLSVYQAGPTAEGLHAYAFEATSKAKTAIRNGWVEVEPG